MHSQLINLLGRIVDNVHVNPYNSRMTPAGETEIFKRRRLTLFSIFIFLAFFAEGAFDIELCRPRVGNFAEDSPSTASGGRKFVTERLPRTSAVGKNSLTKLPFKHNEARARKAEAENKVIELQSNELKAHFEKTPPYHPSRKRHVGFIGVGPHTAAMDYAMAAVLGERYSAFGFNRGPVVSEGVFGNPDPRKVHMTAEEESVIQFPDNIIPNRGLSTLRELYGLPKGSYPPSSGVGESAASSLARSGMDLLMETRVDRVISKEMVQKARTWVARKKSGKFNGDLNEDVEAIAKEPIELWPEGSHFMILSKFVGNNNVQRFFLEELVQATGLGRPNNPFSRENPTPQSEAMRMIVEKEWQALVPLKSGQNRPVPRVHEAAALFLAPDKEVESFTEGPVVALGSGQSMVVGLNRVLSAKPKTPIQLLTKSPLDGARDALLLRLVNRTNAKYFASGVTQPSKIRELENGFVEMDFVDVEGTKQTLVTLKSKLHIVEERDPYNNIIAGSYYVSVDADTPRIQVHVYKPQELSIVDKGDQSSLDISWKDVDGTVHELKGRIFSGIGQTNILHDTMWGANFKANESVVKGDVNFGFKSNSLPTNTGIGRTTNSLRWQVGKQNGEPIFEDVELANPVMTIGPATRRGRAETLISKEELEAQESPNASADSLAALLLGSEAMGRLLADKVKLAPPREDVLIPPPEGARPLGSLVRGTFDVGKISRVIPPTHLENLESADAPSFKMISEGLFAEAGRSLLNVKVTGSPDNDHLKIDAQFVRDFKTGEIALKISGLSAEGARAIYAHIEKDIRFREQLDTWMRANKSQLSIQIAFDSAGRFRPELLRVSTPISALVEAYRGGESVDEVLSRLPRNVPISGTDRLRWIETNFRNLYGVSADANVKILEDSDSATGKLIYVVQENGIDKVVVGEYSNENREVGIRNINGQAIFEENGLGELIANPVDRVAQSVVGRAEVEKANARLFVVYRLVPGGNLLKRNPGLLNDRKAITSLANALARIHRTKQNGINSLSSASQDWIKEQPEKFQKFLRNQRFIGAMSHGDSRLVHLVREADGTVRTSGHAKVQEGHHPLRDLEITLKDMKTVWQGSLVELKLAQIDLIQEYLKASGLTNNVAEENLMREFAQSWIH